MDRRRINFWVGVFLFVIGAGMFALVFPPDRLLGLQTALLAAAGALFVASGVTDRVRWSLLTGLGNVALGLSLAVSGVANRGNLSDAGNLFYGVVVTVGGLTLAVIGVLYVIEHDSFDTTP